MAATATPYGLRPVSMLGGQPMSHGMRLYKIADAYATSIFNGDLVTLASDGTLAKDTGTTTTTAVGVFMGCEYELTDMGLVHKQMWTASTATKTGTTIWGYVCDDPDVLFEIQADDTLAQTALGNNAAIVQGSGNTATGKSGVTLDASTIATTNTLPLRIVDFVIRPGFSAIGDAKTDVLVRINTHFNRSTTGI